MTDRIPAHVSKELTRLGISDQSGLAMEGEPRVADLTPALGWHVISGEDLLAALRRVATGEDPDLVYAELWANAEHERPDAD